MFFLFTFCDCHWLIVWLLPFFLGWIFGMRLMGSYKSRINELENNRLKNSNKIIALEEDINMSHSRLLQSKEDVDKSRQRITQIEAELALAKGSLYEIEEAEELENKGLPKDKSTALKTKASSAAAAVGLGSIAGTVDKKTESSIETQLSNSAEEKLPEVKTFKEIQQEKADSSTSGKDVQVSSGSSDQAGLSKPDPIAKNVDSTSSKAAIPKEETSVSPSEKGGQSGSSLDKVKSESEATAQDATVTPGSGDSSKHTDALGIASAAAVLGSNIKKDEKQKKSGEKLSNKKKAKIVKKKKNKSEKKKSTASKTKVGSTKKKNKHVESGFRQASSGRFKKTEENDLSIIEGIGPKTAELLKQKGITSWAQLAGKTPSELKDVLSGAGSRFSHLDPSTWTRQANLAAGNHWTRLEKLQDKLDGGKDKPGKKAPKKPGKSQKQDSSKKAKAKTKSSKKDSKVKKTKKTSVSRASQSIIVGPEVKKSNLQIIEGIGPKMNSLLNKEGIKSWKELSSHSPGEIRSILDKHGDRYRIVDVKLWPKQASFAAKGQWSKLIDFQKSDGSASKAEKVLKKAGVFKSSKVDDLKLIEGIGPKTEKVLNKAGIKNWATLSKTSSAKLTAIMAKAGKRFALGDTTTWPKQAELAAAGKFSQLEKLQQKL